MVLYLKACTVHQLIAVQTLQKYSSITDHSVPIEAQARLWIRQDLQSVPIGVLGSAQDYASVRPSFSHFPIERPKVEGRVRDPAFTMDLQCTVEQQNKKEAVSDAVQESWRGVGYGERLSACFAMEHTTQLTVPFTGLAGARGVNETPETAQAQQGAGPFPAIIAGLLYKKSCSGWWGSGVAPGQLLQMWEGPLGSGLCSQSEVCVHTGSSTPPIALPQR
ncbi:hypothetical protein SKAU_G00175410 [Synaphobranchus kaupii]|uniref:Uncharacterized protein n=1 Tax=Synaphobranchus kaupii TaxID=118154 RepID=A0A9Q1FLD1_SYNKA|nr:hypothetical protein SKAU_G00175410 [Synaphobranchus kaupii]